VTIAILAVLKRSIIIPATGESAYIDQETEVERFADGTSLDAALRMAESAYPNALSFEIYRPRTDADSVQRV